MNLKFTILILMGIAFSAIASNALKHTTSRIDIKTKISSKLVVITISTKRYTLRGK